MAQQLNIDIVIDGQKIHPFSSLMLRQQINQHHYFEVRFNYDVVEDKDTFNISKSQSMLGKKVTITMTEIPSNGKENVFTGVLTDIRFANHINSPGDLIFCGYSPTIVLETGEANASYLDRTLDQIVKTISGSVPSNELSVGVQPQKKSKLPYIVQYRESHFSFLRRLAAEYGEQFFYDGSKLHFGKPSNADNFALDYPNNIQDINLQLRIGATNFEQYGYLPKDNKKLQSPSTKASVEGLDGFGSGVMDAAKKMYTNPVRSVSTRVHEAAAEVDQAVQMDLSQRAASFVMLHAVSDMPMVKLGATVQFKADKIDYGSFTVIGVTHQTDGMGNYHNEIEAIPSKLAVFPNPHVRKMIAEPQLAEVVDNNDPDKLGRIKVRFLWQKDSETTPFIRIMTPSGGTYGSTNKNRGFHFTPEVGDSIMVGFTDNDPERPFVLGSIPHGKAIDSAENSENHLKTISTRSGNIIKFIDKDNESENEIHIQTDDNNYISINYKNGDGMIKVFSSKAIEITSKETILMQSEKSIDIKSKDINIEATNNVTIKANQKVAASGNQVALEGTTGFEAKSGATAKMSGLNTEISASVGAKVSGNATLELQAAGQATLKGALVMIN